MIFFLTYSYILYRLNQNNTTYCYNVSKGFNVQELTINLKCGWELPDFSNQKNMVTFEFILIAIGAAWLLLLLMLAIVSVGGSGSSDESSN